MYFNFFVGYKINLGKSSIMRPVHIYLEISNKVYPETCLV
jgi:hypothetical protein